MINKERFLRAVASELSHIYTDDYDTALKLVKSSPLASLYEQYSDIMGHTSCEKWADMVKFWSLDK